MGERFLKDNNLRLFVGSAVSFPFGYSRSNRLFNGAVHYTVIQSKEQQQQQPRNENDNNVVQVVPPVPSPNRWETILLEDFEHGFGSTFVSGGNDSYLYTDGSPYALSGKNSAILRDDTNERASIFLSQSLPNNYSKVRVSFWFITDRDLGYERHEEFVLEYTNDNGRSWIKVKRWSFKQDFFQQRGIWYNDQVTIHSSSSMNNLNIRFRSNASNNRDLLYIDDILIEGHLS